MRRSEERPRHGRGQPPPRRGRGEDATMTDTVTGLIKSMLRKLGLPEDPDSLTEADLRRITESFTEADVRGMFQVCARTTAALGPTRDRILELLDIARDFERRFGHRLSVPSWITEAATRLGLTEADLDTWQGRVLDVVYDADGNVLQVGYRA